MNKPTAQELWERITVKILKTSVAWTEAMGDSTGKALDKFDKHEAELHVLVRSYAQTYHEEHTQGTIIDIDGQRYNAVLTPYNPPNQ